MFVLNTNNETGLINSNYNLYPNLGDYNFVGASTSHSYTATGLTGFTITPSDLSTLITVWSTPINDREQLANWNHINVWDYNANNIGGGYAMEILNVWSGVTGALTGTMTKRIMSRAKFEAGKIVGANVQGAAHLYLLSNTSLGGTIDIDYAIKLMRTDGTLVNIGTVSVLSAEPLNTASSQNLELFYDTTFTPQTTQAGDRLVVEPTITVDITTNTSTGYACTPRLAMGSAWSNDMSGISQYMPICISVT